MSKRPVVTKGELKTSLVSKFGFEEVPGKKHEAVALTVNNKRVTTTRFSRNLRSASLHPSLLRQIAGQLRLEPGELSTLYAMVGCTESREDYLKKLKERGYLE